MSSSISVGTKDQDRLRRAAGRCLAGGDMPGAAALYEQVLGLGVVAQDIDACVTAARTALIPEDIIRFGCLAARYAPEEAVRHAALESVLNQSTKENRSAIEQEKMRCAVMFAAAQGSTLRRKAYRLWLQAIRLFPQEYSHQWLMIATRLMHGLEISIAENGRKPHDVTLVSRMTRALSRLAAKGPAPHRPQERIPPILIKAMGEWRGLSDKGYKPQ